MDDPLLAQIIGALGYAIYVLSSRLPTRSGICACEIAGCIVIALHWYMLGELIVIFTNLIAMYSACLGMLFVRFPQSACLQGLSLPMLGGAAYASCDGSIAFYIAVAASSVLLAAKWFPNLKHFRAVSAASGILWAAYGLVVFSIPGTLFGICFALSHISKLPAGGNHGKNQRPSTAGHSCISSAVLRR